MTCFHEQIKTVELFPRTEGTHKNHARPIPANGQNEKYRPDIEVSLSFHDESSDKYYFACIISDATACCSQGIEFVLTDGYSYPDDYPEEGGDVCVVGVFDTYQEGGYTYCTLRNARLV